ncbi:MAG: response regulator [Vicinamibacterales bacterium]
MLGPHVALRTLVVEDCEADALLVIRELRRAGFRLHWRRVDSEPAYVAALDESWDVIVSDYNLPGFTAHRALELLAQRTVASPFIVVSGSIGEETAVDLLKRGASDYLLKDRIARLGSAVTRAIEERAQLAARRAAEGALTETEDRMRFALEAAEVGTWDVDMATGAVQWSSLTEALHGVAPGGFGGTVDAFLELVHAEDRTAVGTEMVSAPRERRESHLLYRTTWPDGTVHWITSIGRTFHDGQGAPVRTGGVAFDVTERLNLEEQYRHAQKMEAVGQLAGGVAHDFNNMLTAIRGYSDLVAESLGDDHPLQAEVGQIRQAAERAAGLTRQLLAFSRRQILEPRVLNLRDVVVAIEPMLRRLIGEQVEIRVVGDAVGNVQADRGQIEQVVLNLAINARDAMPGGGTLTLELADTTLDDGHARLHMGSTPGPHVMLAVSDTGTGMDAQTQKRIFEPFFTTKAHGVGTGLGLSTVFGIVKQSGGNIWVYSEPGEGTTFKVYLPRVDTPVEPASPAPAGRDFRGTETVLLVEDDEAVGALAQIVLRRCGYHVLFANLPSVALDLAAMNPGIDLMVSDIVMPGMNGVELMRRLGDSHPEMRVLFMSGYTDATVAIHGVLSPGVPYLQKPFSPEQLARKVREVLG